MEITLQLDKNTCDSLRDLMNQYNIKTPAEVFTRALSCLKVAAHIDATNGELIARRGKEEAKIEIN